MMASVAADLGKAVRWEWFRVRRRAGFWIVMGLAAAGVISGLLSNIAAGQIAGGLLTLRPHQYPENTATLLEFGAPLLSVVLAAMVFGGDFRWRTWRALVARGQTRWQAALAKFLMLSAVLAALWVVAGILSALTGLAFGDDTLPAGVIAGDGAGRWQTAAAEFFRGLPVAIVYLGLGAVITVVSRSTAAGVGAGIGIVIAESTAYPVVNFILGNDFGISINEYTRWTLYGVTQGFMGEDSSWGLEVFAPALAAYLSGLWGITLASISLRDLRD